MILHSKAAEEGVVIGLMVGNGDPTPVVNFLAPDDFHDMRLRMVYEAIIHCVRRGEDPYVPQVALELDRMGMLDRLGAEPWLVELTSGGDLEPWAWYPINTARVVREWAEKRRNLQQFHKDMQRRYSQLSRRGTGGYEA